MLKFLLSVIVLYTLTQNPLLGQVSKDKITIAVVDFYLPSTDKFTAKIREDYKDNPYRRWGADATFYRNRLNGTPEYATEIFGNDSRFILLDRKSSALINKERELQKNEDFLEGYVVAQGKGIGAQYLLSGNFDLDAVTFTLTLYSVVDNAVIGSETGNIQQSLTYTGKVREDIVNIAQRLSQKVFPNHIKVVEIVEQKKDKAQSLLIAAGINKGLKLKQAVDVFIIEEKVVDGEKSIYNRTVAKAEVQKIEGPNFSIVSLKDGEEEVKKLIDGGRKLYCLPAVN